MINHNSPIKIYGEGAITCRIVLYYMELNMNVAYVEKDISEEHLRSIRSNTIITSDMVDSDEKVKCMVHQ